MYEFTNRETGEKLKCEFLPVEADDAELIGKFILCLREEYGDTYTNKEAYDPAAFAAEIRKGVFFCILAVTEENEAVSCLALIPSEGVQGVLELGMHVVRKPYRGFGVGTELTKALMALPQVKSYSSVTAHSVTFHIKAQHQTISCGLTPTGFLFNVHRNEIITHSFMTGGVVKQSFSVSVFPEGKNNVGTLYPPAEHRGFIAGVYEKLGVGFSVGAGAPLSGETFLNTQQDELHRTRYVQMFSCGTDLESRVKTLLESPSEPEQTMNLLLDLRCPAAGEAYERLRAMGFIFAGLQPLCANGEFMILHHPMTLEIQFDKLCIDEGYRQVFEYIRDRA